MNRQTCLTLFSLLWLTLMLFAQPSAFWRDSGEFIIAARYLDVSHPAGFPLYAILANLFALIPIGPIAFRVNAFSSFTSAGFLTLTALAASETLSLLRLSLAPRVHLACVIVPTLFLLGSAALLKQSLTAEVYVLNGALIAGLYLIALRWISSKDVRWLMLLSFLGAITLGNHAASALVLVPAALVILIAARKAALKALIPGIVVAVMGLLIYEYIPIRANTFPPLNTGDSRTSERALLTITDGRDRALRNNSTQNDLNVIRSAPSPSRFLMDIKADVSKMCSELSATAVILAFAGLILIAARSPSLGSLLAVIGVGAWYFFKGWDPDPWIPVQFVFAIGFAVFLAELSSRITVWQTAPALLLGVAGIIHVLRPSQVATAVALRSYEGPAQYASRFLRSTPRGAPILSEAGWFFLKYARDIEGVREESPLIYQPSILFPGYFSFPTIKLPSGREIEAPQHFKTSSDYNFATQLITDISPYGPLAAEAGVMNNFVSSVITFKGTGIPLLIKGRLSSLEPEFVTELLMSIQQILASPVALLPSTAGDVRHFAEARAIGTAELLAVAQRPDAAEQLLSLLCSPLSASECGEIALNNLGSYRIRMRKFEEAEEVLQYLLNRGTSQRAVVEENLRIARARGGATH